MSVNISLLMKVDLFQRCSFEKLESYLNSGFIHSHKYTSGQYIASSNSRYERLIVLIEGKMVGQMSDTEGKEVHIEYFEGRRVIGIGVIFAKDNYLPVDIIAKTNCEVYYIDKEMILELSRGDRNFQIRLLEMVSGKISFLSSRLKMMSFYNIRQKLASLLLENTDNDQSEIHMSIEDMSRYCGIARPSLSRVLGEMENEGIISHKGKKIIISNRKKLELLL